VSHLSLHRSASLALLGSVATLALALVLAYSHVQYTQYKTSIETDQSGWRNPPFHSKTQQQAPTLNGALVVATPPLVVAGFLLAAALAYTVSSFLAKPQPLVPPGVRMADLEDHRRFLGQMALVYAAFAALALCWLGWAVYVLFRGPRGSDLSDDPLTTRSYYPEPNALLAPLILIAVVLVGFCLSLVNRGRTRRALTKLKKQAP
jgi:hypothetical protein